MDGLKVNAKERQVGSHLDMLKSGNGFLQARWLKCSKSSAWGRLLRRRGFLHVCIFCAAKR